MNRSQKIRSGLRTICAGFFFLTGIAWARATWMKRTQPLVRVLLVHHMRRPEKLERMLQFLTSRYNLITFEDFVSKRLEKKKINILLTLDDGYASWHNVGLPLMKRYGICPVAFVSSGFIGNEISEEQRQYAAEKLLLPSFDAPATWESVRILQKEGWEIAGHTTSHPFLSKLGSAECAQEITEDKKKIEQVIEKPLRAFAYPFGDFTADSAEAVKRAGYTHAFTTHSDFVRVNQDLHMIPRSNHGTVHPFVLRMWVWGAFDFVASCESFARSIFRV